ncbi:putative integral membrane protein [Theileria parva strain Muguga]|uniref:Uncharacterized protein n=1 Tax=Theileria parva TaxID=5875 RepID=Q4MYW5_THEPA|nr:putative integral membrane protein [Theileria parva strain Muguga]EAN30567.1 putative integral membrane protein [Theileria parva strain Muguga]|eukprot:XP_762850.1 hypothetical protein [Theileria parva strain Muguga]
MGVFYGFGGFFFGFLLPVGAGLYCCTDKDSQLADYFLRVLFFWLVSNQVVAPVLNAVFGKVSPAFWSFVYTLFPVLLLVPKFNVLKALDNHAYSLLNSDSLSMVKSKLDDVCMASRRALSTLFVKLQDYSKF